MERAAAEVEQSRVMIDGYEQQLKGYEDALQKAEETDEANLVLIDLLKSEIKKVREALADKQVALAAKQKEADAYKSALSKEVKKKNFYKKIAKFSTVVAVGAIATSLILLKR